MVIAVHGQFMPRRDHRTECRHEATTHVPWRQESPGEDGAKTVVADGPGSPHLRQESRSEDADDGATGRIGTQGHEEAGPHPMSIKEAEEVGTPTRRPS